MHRQWGRLGALGFCGSLACHSRDHGCGFVMQGTVYLRVHTSPCMSTLTCIAVFYNASLLTTSIPPCWKPDMKGGIILILRMHKTDQRHEGTCPKLGSK